MHELNTFFLLSSPRKPQKILASVGDSREVEKNREPRKRGWKRRSHENEILPGHCTSPRTSQRRKARRQCLVWVLLSLFKRFKSKGHLQEFKLVCKFHYPSFIYP
jgi:hypothetical protein